MNQDGYLVPVFQLNSILLLLRYAARSSYIILAIIIARSIDFHAHASTEDITSLFQQEERAKQAYGVHIISPTGAKTYTCTQYGTTGPSKITTKGLRQKNGNIWGYCASQKACQSFPRYALPADFKNHFSRLLGTAKRGLWTRRWKYERFQRVMETSRRRLLWKNLYSLFQETLMFILYWLTNSWSRRSLRSKSASACENSKPQLQLPAKLFQMTIADQRPLNTYKMCMTTDHYLNAFNSAQTYVTNTAQDREGI